jgi:ribose 5-phosphate isomerase A
VTVDARESAKRVAADAAVAEVMSGMLVGLGTGTTAMHAVAALGALVARGLRVQAVATSNATRENALARGIEVIAMDDHATVDLCIDGVDEIDGELRAIKGAGGAFLREKVVASAARRMIAVADASKRVAQLGSRAVPVEVLPEARGFVTAQVAALGGQPVLRQHGTGGLWRTEQCNLVLDVGFGPIADPAGLALKLSAIPGLLGHGLFLTEIDTLIVGGADGVSRTDRAMRMNG